MTKQKRNSSFELLRIFAMMGVLAGHGVGMVNALPTYSDIQSDPISSFFFVFFSCLFACSVNVFVLISGWFGIRASMKGLFRLLFQFFFLLWGVTAFLLLTGVIQTNQLTLRNILGLTEGYWFVVAYIGLYILSPILNLFSDLATKRQQQLLLLSFYVFQCYYSWMTSYLDYFGGYSIVLFTGLYLTARYFKRFSVKWIEIHSLSLFFGMVICATVIMLLCLSFFGHAGRMVRYDTPLIILAGVCLILTFRKWKLQSRFINWLAASCFAVYILHFHPYIFGSFLQEARTIRTAFSGVVYAGGIAFFLVAIYIACTLIDQIRVFIWRVIQKRL